MSQYGKEEGRGRERKGEGGRGRERKAEEGRGRQRKAEEGRGRKGRKWVYQGLLQCAMPLETHQLSPWLELENQR